MDISKAWGQMNAHCEAEAGWGEGKGCGVSKSTDMLVRTKKGWEESKVNSMFPPSPLLFKKGHCAKW